MQISKFPVWICALASAGAMTLHAQDNAAQAAARAALLQKLNELDAPATDTSAPAVANEPAPAAAAPSPLNPAVPLPAKVLIVPFELTERITWLL